MCMCNTDHRLALLTIRTLSVSMQHTYTSVSQIIKGKVTGMLFQNVRITLVVLFFHDDMLDPELIYQN